MRLWTALECSFMHMWSHIWGVMIVPVSWCGGCLWGASSHMLQRDTSILTNVRHIKMCSNLWKTPMRSCRNCTSEMMLWYALNVPVSFNVRAFSCWHCFVENQSCDQSYVVHQAYCTHYCGDISQAFVMSVMDVCSPSGLASEDMPLPKVLFPYSVSLAISLLWWHVILQRLADVSMMLCTGCRWYARWRWSQFSDTVFSLKWWIRKWDPG